MEVDKSSLCDISIPPANKVKRDAEVWLADGNCVVVSKDTAFRVYQGILSLHSEVFRDLFSLGNPCSGDTMDGCPVVQVTDEARDLRRLFLVICCGKNYYHEKDEPKPVPFSVLSSLIRMGHKYAIPKLLEDATYRLKKYYPTSLTAWDDIATRARYVTALPMDAFEAIRLARLTDTSSILPVAFFTCCKNLRQKLDEGDSVERHRFLERLSVDDAWRLVNGRENLVRGILSRLSDLLTTYDSLPSDYRSAHRTCRGRIMASIQALHADSRTVLLKNERYHAAFEPLSDWYSGKPGNPTQRALKCETCLAALKSRDEETREQIWSELPHYFDLEIDGWPTASE